MEIQLYTDIRHFVVFLRGRSVLLDLHLAPLYEIETRTLKQQVKRNLNRFPTDFMFQLTEKEVDAMVSQNVIPSKQHLGGALPFAFTEQGVAMLSSVLRSPQAIEVNIQIMRAFVKMREILNENLELKARLEELERQTDDKFHEVFTALRELLREHNEPRKPIGFPKSKAHK